MMCIYCVEILENDLLYGFRILASSLDGRNEQLVRVSKRIFWFEGENILRGRGSGMNFSHLTHLPNLLPP